MSDDGDSPNGSESGIAMRIGRAVVPDAIRRRFALKFVIVLLFMGLVIGAVGLVATAQITDETQNRIESEFASLSNQQGNLVNQWIEQNEQATKLASENVAWTSNNSTYMSDEITSTSNRFPSSLRELRVFNRSDSGHHVLASTGGGLHSTIENTRRGWVTRAEFDGPDDVRMSSAYKPGSGSPVVGFVSPIAGSENRYLLAEFNVDDLARQFPPAEGSRFTFVVNESGTVVIDQADGQATTTDSATLEEYDDQGLIDRTQSLTDDPSGVQTGKAASSQIFDQSYTVGYTEIILSGTDENWYVFVHTPDSEALGFSQTVERYGAAATVLAVLLMVIIGGVLGYNTSSSIDRLTGKAEEMEEGNLDVDISSARIDNIGRLYTGFASMRDALREQIDEAERARKEAEVSRAEAMEMNTYLQEKAEQYSEIMQSCARGDLTRRMEPEGENEAMDQIADDFNEMITELEMTTGQLKTFAEEVEESGQSVQQSAETVRDASEQVADSVQKISDDAYDQKERLQRISEEMDVVADQLEAFADENPQVDFGDSLASIQDVASMIDEAAELGEETMDESENVAGAAEEQAAELNEVSARAEELTRYAQYLGDGLNNFDTEEEHEFVFQTGAGGAGPGGGPEGSADDASGE